MPAKYAFMLKKGSTKAEHVMYFFDLLHDKLVSWFGDEYITHTVFVFDNAAVHVSAKSKAYFKDKQLSVLTIPSYTPELNYVEEVFRLLKSKLKLKPMYKKRLEYLVAEAITNL